MTKDLFDYQGEQELKRKAPLADRMRPTSIEEFVGQSSILAEGRLLRRAIAADRVGNLLLHGPPGVGKTTLARIIALNTCSHFSVLNAVLSGIKELREEVDSARRRLNRHGLKTILFIDEVHRFNTAQQDALLPWVENGLFTLIGATTENPYFEVNKALVSRSRIFRLTQLEKNDLHKLLQRALNDEEKGYGKLKVDLTLEAANHLVDVANGDARSLLNALELAVETTLPISSSNTAICIDLSIAEESIQQRAVLYDKQGDIHFDTISAFIKSLRGSDPDAALFWLARMVEAGESIRFIFRRMLIAAAEDIGLADPQAIVVVEACAAAFERIGMPEGLYALSQAALYLASAEKSNSLMGFFEAQRIVRSAQKQEVPSHLRDSHRDKDAFGDGKGYRYPHAFSNHWVAQQYLPKVLQGQVFWKPTSNGWEGERKQLLLERRAAQLSLTYESQDDNPLLLTSGPTNPVFERWLQRQFLQESNRLGYLQEKLWDNVKWKRHDRVLIIEGSSILWALSPLKNVPEGCVTIMTSSEEESANLLAHIEILEPIYRPILINNISEELSKKSKQDYFEWIGGRFHNIDLDKNKVDHLYEVIANRSKSGTGLRLLVSSPLIGPSSALREVVGNNNLNNDIDLLLNVLIEKECVWMAKQKNDSLIIQKLQSEGWKIDYEVWEEELQIEIDDFLKERWLGDDRPYRKLIGKNLSKKEIDLFRNIIDISKGKFLPQRLMHKKIIGKMK